MSSPSLKGLINRERIRLYAGLRIIVLMAFVSYMLRLGTMIRAESTFFEFNLV